MATRAALIAAVTLLAVTSFAAPLDLVPAASPAGSHGRRLGWCWSWRFWSCDPPAPPSPPSPKCAKCANPCPAGFTYEEDCASWWQWWKDDATKCVPDRVPDGAVAADTDVTQRGYCSYALTANGEGKFGAEPAACPSGYTDAGVTESTDNCCQPPIWARGGRRLEDADNRRALLLAEYSCDNPLTKPYGYFKTRKCVPNTPTHVFKINEPSSLCPTWDMQSWQTTFDTCTHCGEGESAGSPGSGSTCWLPYSKDAAGKCFAYDAQNVGWWKVTRAADDTDHRDDPWTTVKGGTEVRMPPYSNDGIDW